MRTTVTLDDDVYEAALATAQRRRQRLGKVISEMARRGFKAPVTVPPFRRKGRFPVFSVPADAPIISGERVRKALDEEGYF